MGTRQVSLPAREHARVAAGGRIRLFHFLLRRRPSRRAMPVAVCVRSRVRSTSGCTASTPCLRRIGGSRRLLDARLRAHNLCVLNPASLPGYCQARRARPPSAALDSCQNRPVVVVIQLHQQLPLANRLIVADRNGSLTVPGNSRAEWRHIRAHVSVVGALFPASRLAKWSSSPRW